MSSIDSLAGKVVLVTGGSRGIGRAITLGFAERGCHVTFCYRSNQAAANETVAAALARGWSVEARQVDVADSRAVQQMVDDLLARRGRIDVLVNNAGIFPQAAVTEIGDGDWDEVLRINLSSAFYCCRAVIPTMIVQRDGVIVNIASVAGQRGSAYHAHYAAAKGGLLAFTRSLARELAQHNIRTNAVSPGRITTDLLMEQADEREQQRWLSDTPARRLGTPEEVAAAVIFLAEPASAYIVGETIAVNGGMYID